MNLSWLVVVPLLLSACNSQTPRSSRLDELPLSLGNEWTLVQENYRLFLKVADTIRIGNVLFYELEEKASNSKPPSVVRKRLYTYNSAGSVLTAERLSDTSYLPMWIKLNLIARNDISQADSFLISNWYKRGATVGESWSAVSGSPFEPSHIYPYRIILESSTDTVVTAGKTYYNCLRYYIDDLQESDSEYWDWLAEGIGIVKRVYLSPQGKPFILRSSIVAE